MKSSRDELLVILRELSEADCKLRFGQLIANLATLAKGATAVAIWDAEDEELLNAGRRLLEHYRGVK